MTRLDWALGEGNIDKAGSKGVGRKEQLFAKAFVCARHHVRSRTQARAVNKTVKLLLPRTPPRRQADTQPLCVTQWQCQGASKAQRERGVCWVCG